REKADTIVNTFASFSVKVKIKNIYRGPSITRYEIQPGAGVKVSKIKGLEDDIALSLAAQGVRIEAPVPGKAAVGIEVPNINKDTVTLKEILSSPEFKNSQSKLAFAVGKDIAGNAIVGDITKMPHVIIAGTTGSGKSVCTRSIIMSILYNAKPDEVKIILIDPKVVEFKVFEGIPHLLIPIVTEAKKAAGALNWAVNEMMRRYNKFADIGANDLKSYNEIAEDDDEMQKMHQIVIFIDELADMMLVAGKEVEDSICRLAQMGRAAGMHLVVATQRPTTDVITGLIKANIPSRIALSVMSQVDSRTIIDMAGADKLLGNGDMLYMPIGMSKPVRVQGCFASSKDINRTLDFIRSQAHGSYDSSIIEAVDNFVPQTKGDKGISDSGFEAGSDEDYVIRGAEVAVNAGQLSTTMLQKKLKLGYARASRIMDELEERGIISSPEGSKPRKVLMSKMQFDEWKLRQLEDK
ncbi:MAG: DNA translocase FtsK, partial [Ruminococcus sp.]|nr:DNA translocase FtsK [Ruminococcus sp.]